MVDRNFKALIIDLSDNFGGTNARVLALIKCFPQDFIGLATLRGSQIGPELEGAGYRVHYVAENKFDFHIPFRLVRILQTYKYQLVDTQNPQSKIWGSVAAFFGNVALVSTLNSWYMNEHPKFSLRWFAYSAIELLTNFSLSRYIVVSEEIKLAMLNFGIPVNKIDLIYNAINIDAFDIVDNRSKWITENRLPQDTILCVSAGRLSWAKGQDNLIKAFSILADNNPRVCCLIAGEGDLYSALNEQIKESGLNNRVILLGHLSRPDVLSLIKACDIFIMPSRTEGTPIALLEAATLKKPILATKVGGIPELVRHDEECLLVAPDEPEQMADGIMRLIQDVTYTRKIAENACRKVNDEFSLIVQANSTVLSYNKALKGNTTI